MATTMMTNTLSIVEARGLEEEEEGTRTRTRTYFGRKWGYWALMLASSVALVVGLSSASLLGRYYFVHGGSRRWLYTWIESAGWPAALPLLAACHWKQGTRPTTTLLLTSSMAATYAGLGLLTVVDNLLYSLGMSYLPVSTNSLLCSTQLAFNAVFAFALAGHRLSPAAINAVVVISTATVILAVTSASDRPVGTSHAQYLLGFVVTIGASAIFALLLTLIELTFRKHIVLMPPTDNDKEEDIEEATTNMKGDEHNEFDNNNPHYVGVNKRGKSFAVVLEVQIGISIVASICSLVGMWASNDFSAIGPEASQFDSGVIAYIMTLFWSAIGWELYLLGGAGIIFLSSSLMSCVFMTAMIPILPILAIVFFGDTFSILKGISMVLSIWGFLSYIYDGYSRHKLTKKLPTKHVMQIP